MTPLERYGFPEGDEPRPVRCDSGYWTPWHVATEKIERLRAELHHARVELQRLHSCELPGGWTEELNGQINARHAAETERDALRVAAQLVVQAHDDGEDMQSGIDMLTRLLDAALAKDQFVEPDEMVAHENMPENVRRALAIAQAVDDMVRQEGAGKCAHSANGWIMRRADELLAEKRP